MRFSIPFLLLLSLSLSLLSPLLSSPVPSSPVTSPLLQKHRTLLNRVRHPAVPPTPTPHHSNNIHNKNVHPTIVKTKSASPPAYLSYPSASKDGIPAVKAWALQRVSDAEQSFSSSGLKRNPSPSSWQNDVVYSIQVDRFNNGDGTNDLLNAQDWQISAEKQGDIGMISEMRHGGDLQGIMNRVDYLVDLGISSVWITPVVMNDGSYHGYCTVDMTTIDPSFGDNALFQQFVTLLHSKGIKVVMDIVVNHHCDVSSSYSTPPANHEQCAQDYQEAYWAGVPISSQNAGDLNFGSTFFPPFDTKYFFNRCGANSGADTSGEGPAAVFGDFVNGMYDFATYNYDWQEIYTNLYKYWIAYADIDGFRLDASKHVTSDFLAYFSTNIRSYANGLGKNNFYIVGEVAASAPMIGERLGVMETNIYNVNQHGNVPSGLTIRLQELQSTFLNTPNNQFPGLTAVYDFTESGTSRSYLQNAGTSSSVANYFASSDTYNMIKGQANPLLSWTLLEIHDWPRYFSVDNVRHDPYNGVSAAGYLLMAQGIPIVYYGLEQGLNADCHFDSIQTNNPQQKSSIEGICNGGSDDSLKRQDFWPNAAWRLGSAQSSIDGLNTIMANTHVSNPSTWQNDPYLNTGSMLYQTFRKLIFIRKSCGALTNGNTYWRYSDNNNGGVGIFSRLTPTNGEIIIIINAIPTSLSLPSSFSIDHSLNGFAGIKYVNLLDTTQVMYSGLDGNGGTELLTNTVNGGTVDGHSVMVMVNENNVGAYDNRVMVNGCNN